MQTQNFLNNKIKDDPKKSGEEKLIDALHNKNELPSLRTYQGDIAGAIKNKDESLTSIFMKEKARQREDVSNNKSEISFNLTKSLLAIVLLVGSCFAIFSIYSFIKKENIPSVISERKDIIPVSGFFSIRNFSPENIKMELDKVVVGKGVSAFDLFNKSDTQIKTTDEFFRFLKINPPEAFIRNMGQNYMLGVFNDGEKTKFLIIETKDFGIAFSNMMLWESNMLSDLGFLLKEQVLATGNWRDLIIKNKDLRAFSVENEEKTKENFYPLLYTFLNKNTILIANDINGIEKIINTYSSSLIER